MYGSRERERPGGMPRMESVKMFGPGADDESAAHTAPRDYIKTDAEEMHVQD